MAMTDWYCEEVLSGKLPVQRIFGDERVLAFHHPYPAARPHAAGSGKSLASAGR